MHILNISTEKLLMAFVCLSSSLKAAELVDATGKLDCVSGAGSEKEDVTSIILV